MKRILMSLTLVALCLAAVTVWADMLEMKDGQLLEGKVFGRNAEFDPFSARRPNKSFPGTGCVGADVYCVLR